MYSIDADALFAVSLRPLGPYTYYARRMPGEGDTVLYCTSTLLYIGICYES